MSDYTPDNWVVVKMKGDTPHYRVLAGWSGGYLNGDSWRMNSGIVRVEEEIIKYNEDYSAHVYHFYGSSGSCYTCGKNTYGLRMNNAGVWNQLEQLHGDKVELMPEETDWINMDWIIH